MADEPRVRELLDELFDRQATPEEVCGAFPELLPVVRERWRQICQARAELDALLPICPNGTLPTTLPEELPLPQVPGHEVQSVLGRGGMGVVFRARHLRLGRLVALKMTLAGSYASPHERERFRREAEAVAALRHPNLVQVYDAGDWAGRPYFTMELMEGGSLAEKLAGTPQPARQAAALLATLAEAVQVAHQGGIVHRDLKPANVLLTADGFPKIADFGLARRLEGDAKLTQSGVLMGTPSYMAPEQGRGQPNIGPAVDVYALGAILYELLTGRPPFRGESAAETVHQLLTQDPVPPSRLNGKVPRALETICLMCLRKEPARRYATAAELSADLRRFLRHEPIMARPIGPLGRLSHWVRRHPGLAASLSAVAVLLVLLATGSLAAMLYFRETALEIRRSLYSAEMNLSGQAATSPSGIGRVHDWLMSWNDSDLRGWEWFYLYGLCHRDLDTQFVSKAGLWCIAASPDGERFATAGNDSAIYVFDARSRNLISRLTGHDARVWAVAWSPDGAQLASACWDGSIKTWDAKTARELLTIRNENKRLYAIAWNKDATLLATAGESDSVWIWDATTGKLVQRLDVHEVGVRGVAWHPSENRIASAGMDATIRVWDLNDPRHPMTIKGHGNWVNKVAWHPDGSRLASVSNDRSCKIWNTRDGSRVANLEGHSEGVLGICWSSDGRTLATCGEDQTIRVWNTNNEKAVAALRGHTRKVTAIDWCNGIQQFVSCSDDGTVKFWSAAPQDETPRFHVDGPVNDLAWSPDGLRIAESNGTCPVKLLDPSDRHSPIVFGKELSSHSVSWDSNGKRLASGGSDSTVHVWNVDSGDEVCALRGNCESIRSVAWSHHSSALAAIDDGSNILVWNADSGALLLTLDDPQHRLGHRAFCFAIAWSPDDRCLASAWNDGTVRVHEVDSGKQLWSMWLHGGESTTSVAWSIDGKSIASAGGDSMIYVSDAATGAVKQTLRGHTSAVMSVAWHPGGDRLASASGDRSVKVWDPITGKLMLSLIDPSSEMKTVAWSPDGKTLAAGSGDGIIIYDAVPGFKAAGISNSTR
jgi:eukaryotic-like serine/threonine-protein kinase